MSPDPDRSTVSDETLVRWARARREDGYRGLSRRYQRSVVAFNNRMVRDRDLAEDLTQETFVKAIEALETYRPECEFQWPPSR